MRPLQLGTFRPRWLFFEVSQHALVRRPLWQKDTLTLVRDCDLSHRAVGPMRVISQILSSRRAVLAFAPGMRSYSVVSLRDTVPRLRSLALFRGS